MKTCSLSHYISGLRQSASFQREKWMITVEEAARGIVPLTGEAFHQPAAPALPRPVKPTPYVYSVSQ